MEQRRRAILLRWLPTLGLAALLLCAAALINGGPILYPDTLAYLIDADRLAHLQTPYAVRPIFYGVALWPLHWHGRFALALFAQALIVAHLIALTIRASGVRLGPLSFLTLIAALVLLTPLSWHVSHLLPDVFVAALVLCLYLLAFCRPALGRIETVYLFLLAAASASFHLTALPVGAAVFALAAVASLLWGRQVRPLLALGPLLLALALSLGISFAVWQRLTLTPNSPPHFMARLIADGPGRDFLRARCPEAGLQLCAYLDRLPRTEDDFLWGLLPTVPPADGRRIRAEAGQVVEGTIAMFPAQVAAHMLANAAAQLVTIRSEPQFDPGSRALMQREFPALADAASDTLQARGALDHPALDPVNAVHAGVALASLMAALVLLWRATAAGQRRPAALIGVVLTALLANALACGAFAGVFPRYQGRMIWLLPFAAAVAALALAQSRTGSARRRTRTGKPSRTSDFKSAASTTSARRA